MRSWADIETLRVIFDYCFPFVEKLKFKSVCRSWRAIAEFELQYLVNQRKPPLLFLPRADNYFPASGLAYGPNRNLCKIYNIENNEYVNVPPPPRDRWIMPENSNVVGSCRRGWLLLMKKTPTLSVLLSLWNPRYDIQIHLPDCVQNRRTDNDHWITKAALVGCDDPLVNSTEYGVVIMYGDGILRFAKQGDSNWSELPDEKEDKLYLDVTSFGNSIIALSHGEGLDLQIDVWKFITNTNYNNNNTSSDDVAMAVVSTMKISVSRPSVTVENMPESVPPLNYRYSSQMYVVHEGEEESGGRILLVVRWIGNFVDENGKLWTEDELIVQQQDEEEEEIVDCTYRTLNFYVFGLDAENKKWVRVNNLGNNQVLFVGGNQAVSWQASNDESNSIRKNSIYFTDDYWDRMEEHEYYGGHDMGIFTLEDRQIHQIFPFYLNKISPPFWLLP